MAQSMTQAPPAAAAQRAAPADQKLKLDDILKLMLADGLVAPPEAEALKRSRTLRFEHPLEAIADRKWKSAVAPHRVMTLEWLVEWLAGKLGIPYLHIDPLKIELGAVTATMSNAYAERYRILPVAVNRMTLTVATAEPFTRSWADELGKILKLDVKLVFSNPQDIKRYLGEFYNLARSMKRAQEASTGDFQLARNFEQLVELGKHGHLDANDQHIVRIVDWLWQYAFEQRASDIHIEPRRDVGLVRFRIDGILHQVYTIPQTVLDAVDAEAHGAHVPARLDVDVGGALLERVLPQPVHDVDDVLVVGVEVAMRPELDELLEVADGERTLALLVRALHRACEVEELADVAPDLDRIGEDELHLPLDHLLEVVGPGAHERL